MLDVRSAEEYNGPEGHVPGSLLLPLPEHVLSSVARLGLPLRAFELPLALEPVAITTSPAL